MLKRTTIILSTLMLTFTSFSQDVQKAETKMEAFASRSGTIVKFIDTKLSGLKLTYGLAETRIRKIISGTEEKYFFQIESGSNYSSTASIDYTDLLEVIKAIKILNAEIEKDIALSPDYLENKFTTTDGFQVGYYVSKGKKSWYLKLEKYGSNNTIFVKDGAAVEAAFTEAKNKIEELKK